MSSEAAAGIDTGNGNDNIGNIGSSVMITYALAALGLYALLWWLVDNLRSLAQIVAAVLTPFFQPQDDLSLVQRFGEWAVVTGSTDGIGREYSLELASKGFNIVLISRTPDKLVQVSNEIESKYPVKTKWIQADFSQGSQIYEHIQRELVGIPVGVLVNNVGRMYDYPDEMANVDSRLLADIVNINITAVTMMTRMLVGDMKQRGRGAIVNVSSGSSMQPLPYMAVYAASKVYVRNFTLAIRHELAAYGICVQLLSPMYVRTKMNDFSSTVMAGNLCIPDVRSYTRSAVFSLGKSDISTGYWSHGVQYALMSLVPMCMRTYIGAKMNERFRDEYFQLQAEAAAVKKAATSGATSLAAQTP